MFNRMMMMMMLLAEVLGMSAFAGDATAGGGPVLGVDPLVPNRAMVRIAVNSADPQADLNAFLAVFNAQYPGTTVIDSTMTTPR